MSDGGGIVRRVSTREVYRNPWMALREDEIRRPDGSAGIYSVVDKPDFALVIPAEPDGFHLVEQYRYPVGGRYWEFPQGTAPGGAAVTRPSWPGPSWPRRPGCGPARLSRSATCTARTG